MVGDGKKMGIAMQGHGEIPATPHCLAVQLS